MDNKLSELSKPVAWTWNAYGMQHVTTEADESAELILDGVDVTPLYSQEYVSALLAELEASKQYAKERDAENESLALTVGRLRAKLATPVLLPPLMDGELFGKNSGTANAHNNAITACSIAIRGAGFKSEAAALKCVGDE
ncbi:ead/Ea22-like family protein [Serratia proteamaculans]|uniref:ead/Ea22-like family protein n=1 Tax=Serratia proteamaculans TaxID=28151 RepID=UPI0010D3BB03|nr:ead/Ea22-like family protein [Serratia proteamaculans]RYM55608.1 hypothetical protein BSQ96_02565 [Serratia proteamaculans]